MEFNDGMLRELHKNLGHLAAALGRTERGVTQLAQVFQRAEGACGDAIRVKDLNIPTGRHPYLPEMYTGPEGGYYEHRYPNIFSCWSPAGVQFRRHRHPDAVEYVFIKSGHLIDLVTGATLTTGHSLEIAPDQAHQYLFPVDTHWVIVYGLTDRGADEQAGD